MILGSGTHRYELVEGWGKLPDGIAYGYTHGVVTDAQDNVYVHNQSKDAVIVFDRDGNFLKSWGEEFQHGAHGLFLSREGGTEYLYLADNARHSVTKTTLDGEVLWTLTTPPRTDIYETPEQFVPTDTAVAPGGDFYVCDGYGKPWVHHYSAQADYLGSWGGPGSGPGELNCPHGVWVDTRGPEPQVLVADRGNSRIQIFTPEGKHKGFVTDELRLPCCFFVKGDDVYIPDLSSRVTIFDKDNHLITHLGDSPGCWERPDYPNIAHEDRVPGKFISPHALCVDSRDDIYVVEWVSDGRVTKLRRI